MATQGRTCWTLLVISVKAVIVVSRLLTCFRGVPRLGRRLNYFYNAYMQDSNWNLSTRRSSVICTINRTLQCYTTLCERNKIYSVGAVALPCSLTNVS